MATYGRYIIETELGAGAMGVVYLANDPQLARRIALKTYRLPDGVTAAQRNEFRERFLREARAAAALAHPGIVTVYDAAIGAGDEPFIAMEFVDGRSLRDIIADEGRLDPDRACEIVGTLAEAVGVAHEAGIVHRDVKPANILVRESDGAVKLADFGVARMQTSELTRSGASLGSPSYMSPEQVQGRPIDRRSDLFSLAVVLYELLAGERPFDGEDVASIALAIVQETPIPVTRRVAGLPPGLDGFFERALAKRPEERFPDAATFCQALNSAVHDRPARPGSATVVDPPAVSPAIDGGPARWTAAARRAVLRHPRWSVAAGVVFVACVWLLWGGSDVELRLEAKSSIESGTLTIRIDDDLLYTRELTAPQLRKGLLKTVLPQQNRETFEAWLKVPPGKHQITAEISPLGYRDAIVVELESGKPRTLRVVAGRKLGAPLSVVLD